MASPLQPATPEIIEHGRPRRAPHPRRRLHRVVAGGVLVALVGSLAVVDHRARASESVRVASCVSTATSAVGYADARSDAIVTYVRPTFESGPPDALRRRLLGLVSISVAPTVPVVRRARASCAGTRVLWFHRGAAATREDCLRLLDRDLAFLDRVTVDGLRAFEARSLPVGTCHGPAAT